MRKFFISTGVLLLIGFVAFAWLSKTSKLNSQNNLISSAGSARKELKKTTFEKLQRKAAEASSFIKENNYNNKLCFLVDMSLPSGQNRFFVFDLTKDSIKNSGLVTHGRCNQYWLEGRKYGNTVGCGCSSLGKYKIGYSYKGRFGLAWKLYGLDKTNDKAFERFVVLHGHSCVPETENKDEICQSDGCPTVSPNFLQYLKPIISESKKPVLLWIYE